MNYYVSMPGNCWKNAIVIPRFVLDEHLRLVSAKQLKALLFIFSSNAENVSSEKLALFIGCQAEEIDDIMEYWIATGIINRDCSVSQPLLSQLNNFSKEENEKEEEIPQKVTVKITGTNEENMVATKVMDAPRLSPKDVVARANEDKGVAGLLKESQSILCRTISHSEQEMLVNMIDYYGLKPEVVLMILDYSKEAGKANTRYISALAKNWGDEGIDTVAKAAEKLDEIAVNDNRWNEICEIAELQKKHPTPKQREFVNCWLGEWCFSLELVGKAFELAKDNEVKKTFPYVNKILSSWFEKGIKTLSDIADEEEKHSSQQQQPSKKYQKGKLLSPSTYDIDQIEEESFAETLNFGG